MSNRHTLTFTAGPEHIDELGHVNNAVWVTWIQDIATSHWSAVAPQAHQEAYVWVVTRHEIDYRGNIGPGESVTAETFIPEGPTGARFDRCVEFRNGQGRVIVSARTTWALIDRASGRLLRVPREVAATFLGT
ncbi:thioesterase-like protein [Novosphingobium aromaticivorans DSM 12444]|uniref:Thioesterase-like protein n=1 Tax=Novosphingobium aromaticivorans (strain ATCC 700278 / DSM 12444 / CCUG 56034 / CIP 105152 / NBRC 16084 / F199) TaxID=279238 RepID=Q2GB89_NOVAD|nr:acyl-CoA thioesterase [Novosphingobium aromaticivorans]ABD24884.1 thioesterase-like protein [Novosphingobium aromaticivorans DSM 12444]SCY14611.1 acyl-CoA thioester hydrolase [Novosphingobium aromaticivorans]